MKVAVDNDRAIAQEQDERSHGLGRTLWRGKERDDPLAARQRRCYDRAVASANRGGQCDMSAEHRQWYLKR
jgi:hypothetical protein